MRMDNTHAPIVTPNNDYKPTLSRLKKAHSVSCESATRSDAGEQCGERWKGTKKKKYKGSGYIAK